MDVLINDFAFLSRTMLLFTNPEQNSTDPIKPKRSSALVQDHLANERTYMSWMRTAIALMGFGIFMFRFRADQPLDWAKDNDELRLGFIFAITGMFTVFISTWHYFAIRHRIRQNNYKPTKRSVIFLSTIVTLLGIGIIYVAIT